MSNDPTPTPAATSAAPAPAPDPLAEERARVAGILAEAAALGMLPQAEKLVASGTSLADARLSLRDAKLAAIAAAAPAPVGTDPTPSAVHASLPLGERAKMEFASRPDIRDEFGRVEHYEAWLRNEPLVRLYTKATDMAAPRAAGR